VLKIRSSGHARTRESTDERVPVYEFVALIRRSRRSRWRSFARSPRARRLRRRASGTIQWDLKADPAKLVERYFTHMYFANWGTHRLIRASRWPGGCEDVQSDSSAIPEREVAGKHLIFDLQHEDEEPRRRRVPRLFVRSRSSHGDDRGDPASRTSRGCSPSSADVPRRTRNLRCRSLSTSLRAATMVEFLDRRGLTRRPRRRRKGRAMAVSQFSTSTRRRSSKPRSKRTPTGRIDVATIRAVRKDTVADLVAGYDRSSSTKCHHLLPSNSSGCCAR